MGYYTLLPSQLGSAPPDASYLLRKLHDTAPGRLAKYESIKPLPVLCHGVLRHPFEDR